MEHKEQSGSTEHVVADEAKKARSTKILNAFLIGIAIGVLIYGVAKNNIGFFALIPLFIAFKLLNRSNGKSTSP